MEDTALLSYQEKEALETKKLGEIDNWHLLQLETFSSSIELSQAFGDVLKGIDSKRPKPDPDADEDTLPFPALSCFLLFIRIYLYRDPQNGRKGNHADADDIFTLFLAENASPRFWNCPPDKNHLIQEAIRKKNTPLNLFEPALEPLIKIIVSEFLPVFLKSPQYLRYKSGLYSLFPLHEYMK